MKFSEAWLREWVDPGIDREELFKQLTMAGLEVDGLEPVAGKFSQVVVARIETCEAHPNADKLQVCTVNDGTTTHQVVCGAPNARAGLTTAFAQVGAVLGEDFKIKKAKLRGVESFGMLCSAAELEYGDDHDGILELDESLTLGASVRDALNLDDLTVDLDLTPNRGDCLSLKGIAREVGVLNNVEVSYPEIAVVSAEVDDTFSVVLESPEGCPRYLGRVIKNVDVTQPTPGWMRDRLQRCGLRSIDAIVDVTNYVLLEQGQPMHAFDLKQLSDGIVVRMAKSKEKLTLLDGQEVNLDEETLLITDSSGPVAIAGVMGGERSGVQPDTQDVFLECAFFSPLTIAGTARRYGLHTDASHRYERGVDSALQAAAMERATGLLIDIVGGQAGPVVESVSEAHLPVQPKVSLRHSRLTALLGAEIPVAQVDECLARLGLDVVEREDSGSVTWTVLSPSHRFDIAIEEDLVEEVCRVFGYNNIPSKRPTADLALREVALEKHDERALKELLVQSGLQEVITYTFVEPGLMDLLDPGAEPLALANPMSREQSVMRTNMAAGLVDALQANRARQQNRVGLFELGLVFQTTNGLEQPLKVAGLIWGKSTPESWHTGSGEVDFYDLKGITDLMIAWSGREDITYQAANDAILHPGQSAVLVAEQRTIGRLGRLHPEIEGKLGVTGVYLFELDAEEILARPKRTHSAVSKFPSVRRDLAIVIDKSINASEVERVVRIALGENLVDFTLFDVYKGKGIDFNVKSLAIGLTFQSQTATLTEEEIGGFADAALGALQKELSAKLR
ncbi:MAG: phenylalanyl-tRNA synthetase beta chain [Candidatus Azotimanducaceae bacterium]|jgi:phenylalanyl-tRNA synthetase beta chain